MPELNNFSVVLVEPSENLNIGMVARAMKNLGFSDLRLIAPPGYDRERAKITACSADDILDKITIFDTLEQGVSDAQSVVGFSSRLGRNRLANLLLPEWIQQLQTQAVEKVALVFGPEDNGLRMEHVEHCRYLVRIPCSETYHAFNLAQAVLISLYMIASDTLTTSINKSERQLPTWNEFYQLDRIVQNILVKTGFYRDGTPEPIPGLVKNLFRRIDPDQREMGILLGLFARIEKNIEENPSASDLVDKVEN